MSSTGPPSRITSGERRWVLGFIALFLLLTSLPYLLGYWTQGQDYRYTGFVFGVEDGNSYLAKMLSGAYGAWKFTSSHSAYPQAGVWIFPLYILLGKLASPPGLHEQLVAIFHLLRLVGVLLALLATYDFLAFFVSDIRLRRFGLALVALGSGLGWLLVALGRETWLGSLPLDFYSPEAFGFLSLFGIPHLALARALLLWALLIYLRAVRAAGDDQGRLWSTALRLCLLWLLIGLAQPLTMAVLGAVLIWHLAGLAAWQIVRQRRGLRVDWIRWRQLAGLVVAAGLIPGMLLLYNTWAYYSEPYVQAWLAQDHLRSPHLFHYLFAYGLLLPYAILGGLRLLRANVWTAWLLPGWIILFPMLAYIPLDLQRRLTEGVWVAWITLAVLTIEGLADQPTRRRWVSLPLWLLFPSVALLLIGGLVAIKRPSVPLFRTRDEVRLFEFLQSQAQPGSVVLAAYETGNPLPAWAPVRVLVGMGAESINLSELMSQVKSFYSTGATDMQRLDLIRRFDVQYVFWGPAEQALGDWFPAEATFLQPVYQSGAYQLFKVVGNP
jgi:hypothetical protein